MATVLPAPQSGYLVRPTLKNASETQQWQDIRLCIRQINIHYMRVAEGGSVLLGQGLPNHEAL